MCDDTFKQTAAQSDFSWYKLGLVKADIINSP